MRLLLDTHAFIWFCHGHARLSQKARLAIEDRNNEVYFSAASYWEICLKIAKGKLILEDNWQIWTSERIQQQGFQWLGIERTHCEATVELVTVHGDPFDRMLLAQANVEGLTLITVDPNLVNCGVPIL